MVRAAGPERRMMPIPPRPGGVEMATMVSSNSVMERQWHGFSYGNGRKKCWRGGGAFLLGVSRKVGCRNVVF